MKAQLTFAVAVLTLALTSCSSNVEDRSKSGESNPQPSATPTVPTPPVPDEDFPLISHEISDPVSGMSDVARGTWGDFAYEADGAIVVGWNVKTKQKLWEYKLSTPVGYTAAGDIMHVVDVKRGQSEGSIFVGIDVMKAPSGIESAEDGFWVARVDLATGKEIWASDVPGMLTAATQGYASFEDAGEQTIFDPTGKKAWAMSTSATEGGAIRGATENGFIACPESPDKDNPGRSLDPSTGRPQFTFRSGPCQLSRDNFILVDANNGSGWDGQYLPPALVRAEDGTRVDIFADVFTGKLSRNEPATLVDVKVFYDPNFDQIVLSSRRTKDVLGGVLDAKVPAASFFDATSFSLLWALDPDQDANVTGLLDGDVVVDAADGTSGVLEGKTGEFAVIDSE